jgi:hypothetical protein
VQLHDFPVASFTNSPKRPFFCTFACKLFDVTNKFQRIAQNLREGEGELLLYHIHSHSHFQYQYQSHSHLHFHIHSHIHSHYQLDLLELLKQIKQMLNLLESLKQMLTAQCAAGSARPLIISQNNLSRRISSCCVIFSVSRMNRDSVI